MDKRVYVSNEGMWIANCFVPYGQFVRELSTKQLFTLKSLTGPFLGWLPHWTEHKDMVLNRTDIMRDILTAELDRRHDPEAVKRIADLMRVL